jgi:hypothetical protein
MILKGSLAFSALQVLKRQFLCCLCFSRTVVATTLHIIMVAVIIPVEYWSILEMLLMTSDAVGDGEVVGWGVCVGVGVGAGDGVGVGVGVGEGVGFGVGITATVVGFGVGLGVGAGVGVGVGSGVGVGVG